MLFRRPAPVIFFQGSEDRVVPPNQTELIVALKERSGPVGYLLFDGEQHGFRSRQYKARPGRRVLFLRDANPTLRSPLAAAAASELLPESFWHPPSSDPVKGSAYERE